MYTDLGSPAQDALHIANSQAGPTPAFAGSDPHLQHSTGFVESQSLATKLILDWSRMSFVAATDSPVRLLGHSVERLVRALPPDPLTLDELPSLRWAIDLDTLPRNLVQLAALTRG